MIEVNTLVTGMLIFAARIADVSLGTVRIIITEMARDVSNGVRSPYFLLGDRRSALKRK